MEPSTLSQRIQRFINTTKEKAVHRAVGNTGRQLIGSVKKALKDCGIDVSGEYDVDSSDLQLLSLRFLHSNHPFRTRTVIGSLGLILQ